MAVSNQSLNFREVSYTKPIKKWVIDMADIPGLNAREIGLIIDEDDGVEKNADFFSDSDFGTFISEKIARENLTRVLSSEARGVSTSQLATLQKKRPTPELSTDDLENVAISSKTLAKKQRRSKNIAPIVVPESLPRASRGRASANAKGKGSGRGRGQNVGASGDRTDIPQTMDETLNPTTSISNMY
ncbi:hypothetical protein R1sor_000946 [Riccia sorocarpa]|uniref:Uncharacterized protein n=1 Tax=Riccia sorocarpa TaxID=122646 RepID=A0ABD3H0L4_9MARC